MNWNKILTISFSALYIFLTSLLFYKYRIDILCGYKSRCLRFCSTDTEKYSNKDLFDSLVNNKLITSYSKKFEDVKIYRGLPECNGDVMKLIEYEKNTQYSFLDYPYRIYEGGDLQGAEQSYILSRYCMDKTEPNDDYPTRRNLLNEWMPMICTNNGDMHKPIIVTMTATSIIILAITLLVYLRFPDLRDFNGKMIIFFLISMICTYLIIPGIVQFEEFTKLQALLRAFAFSSGNLWINAILINIFLRFRQFKTKKTRDDNFKSYATYVSIFTVFAVLFTFFERRRRGYSSLFISMVQSYLIFNDLIVIIITLLIIRKVSKQIDVSERPQFEKEKKIFWIYVKIYAIMSVTWSIQNFVSSSEPNHFGSLMANLIMLFTAVNVSGLFLGRKRVRELLSQTCRGTAV